MMKTIIVPLILFTLGHKKILATQNEKSCLRSMSIPLSHDSHRYINNASFVDYEEVLIPEEYQWSDGDKTYGCICNISTTPCIRKCCEKDEFLTSSITPECIKINGTERPILQLNENNLDDELKNISDISKHFRIINNKICPGATFRLLPEEYEEDKNFILYSNGSLWTSELLPQWRYCIDWEENIENIYVLVCHLPETDSVTAVVTAVYPIGIIVSIPCLIATLIVYAIIPELRNLYGKTLMCYVGCLIAAYVFLASERFIYHKHVLCEVYAFIIHFSFLSSFFWLNVMCFDIWWTFGGFRGLQGTVKQRERKKFIIYSIYAWGCASCFTGICLIMDFLPQIPPNFIRPQFGETSCWFMTDTAKAIYFYAPMGVTIVCNITLFISTALKIIRHKKETAHHLKSIDSRRHDDNKQWFNLYLKLFIVMGISWSMEIISWLFKDAPEFVWYVTDLTNTLQGVIIFIIFVWKDKIKRLLLKRFGIHTPTTTQWRNSTRSAGFNSSNSPSKIIVPLRDQNSLQHISNVEQNRFATTTTDDSDCV